MTLSKAEASPSGAVGPRSGARRAAKRGVQGLSLLCVAPLLLAYHLLRVASGSSVGLAGFSQVLALLPGRLGVHLRAAFFSHCCPGVHTDVSIGFLTLLAQADIDIGAETYIGPQGNLGSCSIGAACLLGSGVHVLSGKGQHDFTRRDVPIKDQTGQLRKISIGRDCWIGNNVTVLANLGDGCVVAAGSVVVHDVDDNTIVAGNPARPIGQR